MSWQGKEIEWLIRLLFGIGGIAVTILGSWIASKIRVYHDNRKAHLEDLKARVLTPLHDVVRGQFSLVVAHQSGVIFEELRPVRVRAETKVVEDDIAREPGLGSINPWPEALEAIDGVLYEDAKRIHFPNLILEIEAFSSSWAAHAERCRVWIERIAAEILKKSRLNAFQFPALAPYVMHYRLAVFAYRRLFHLKTRALSTTFQGQYWLLDGAPVLPDVTGAAAFATKEQLDALLVELDQVISSHLLHAQQLAKESKKLAHELQALRRAIEYEIAKTRLHGRCDLVTFF
jgi:hypothetical protein